MTLKVLLDSNIISFFLRGEPNVVSKISAYSNNYNYLTFSILSYYEIKSGLQYRNSKNLLSIFTELAVESEILELDRPTIDVASEIYCHLRMKGLLVPAIDILIGASAVRYELVLVSDNIKHFVNMPGLRLENWKT